MTNILLLTTYTGFFATSLVNPSKDTGSMDINVLERLFQQKGYNVKTLTFDAVNDLFQYKGWYVLYASSESAGLFYKDYIEDVLLSLKIVGAILLPDFIYFRAHHNKSFMEMLRKTFQIPELKTITSRSYWSYDSMQAVKGEQEIKYPVVIKASAGAGSKGVDLIHSSNELKKKITRMSKRFYWDYDIKHNYYLIETIKNFVRRITFSPHVYYFPRAEKFVLQNFISGLKCDYKVLIFGEKYYILRRSNRENDFRASGSGKFVFPLELNEVKSILDYALTCKSEIHTPLHSLDIGFDGNQCHLIEFQCVNFGPYTLQKAPCWYHRTASGEWQQTMGTSVLEDEFVNSINSFIMAK